jgi:hypothetical protein
VGIYLQHIPRTNLPRNTTPLALSRHNCPDHPLYPQVHNEPHFLYVIAWLSCTTHYSLCILMPLAAHHLCPTCTLIGCLLSSHWLQTRSSQGKQETLGSPLLSWRRKSDLGRGHFQVCLLWEFTLSQHFLLLSGNTFYERLELDDTKISLFNLQCNFIFISGPN